MSGKQPLQEILIATRAYWDRPQSRTAVRENFDKVTACRTAKLGAEVFASETEEKILYHSCKSRSCPSCGQRATLLWQREQWSVLPEIPYCGICFTMPRELWTLFRENRQLLHDLPPLAAAVIQQWAKIRYGVRVVILVVPHTFGRDLKFNPHLHIIVSAGGLQEPTGRWIVPLGFDRRTLMPVWRYAVIRYLRAALKSGILASAVSTAELRRELKRQYERWWNIDVADIRSKWHFLRYVARYVRRPPIAQHRFTKVTDHEVEFLTKDLKEKRVVTTHYAIEKFVELLAEHVPDHYRHAMRRFGLLAPRTQHTTSLALFLLLGQERRRRPARLRWRGAIQKYFGTDPLVDSRGQIMHWIARLKPMLA